MNVYGIVYLFLNTRTNCFYVGATKDSNNRFRSHWSALRSNKHKCTKLQQSWNEQNGEAFEIQVVEKVFSQEDLPKAEKRWLKRFVGKEACYNNVAHAIGHNTQKKSALHKERIAEGVANYWANKNHPQKGIPRTEEVKLKISQSQIGKKLSEETKEKIRQAHLGKPLSEERKQALRKPKLRTQEHANKFKKAIVEITTGQYFDSLKAVKEKYDIAPATLAKFLKRNQIISKGRLKGMHFQYVNTPSV